MCGIFGLIGPTDSVRAITFLTLASQRGPHGWGICVGDRRIVRAGKFDPRKFPHWPTTIEPVIGHARLATSADRTSEDALQPLVFDDFAIAHNGTVPNALELVHAYRFDWRTGNDSEIVGRLIEREASRADFPAAITTATARLSTPFALVVKRGGGIWFARRHHPLYASRTTVCSRPFEGGELIPENTIYQLGENT